jgi:hypothetical protein
VVTSAGPKTVNLSGTGRVSGVVGFSGTLVSGSTLAFGTLPNGTVPSTVILTVSGNSVTFGNLTVNGGNGNRFSKSVEDDGDTCSGLTLAVGSTCQVIINFNANGNTARTGSLIVPHDGNASPQSLTLTGQ